MLNLKDPSNHSGHIGMSIYRKCSFARPAVARIGRNLKDGSPSVLVAVWTYEVAAIRAAFPVLLRINQATGWGAIEFILIKLGLRGLRLSNLLHEQLYLRLKKSIVEARVLHCQRKLVHGGFNLRVAATLRRLQKALDGSDEIGGPLQGAGQAVGPLEQAIERLRAEIHDYLRLKRDLSGYSEKIGLSASPVPSPVQGGAR